MKRIYLFLILVLFVNTAFGDGPYCIKQDLVVAKKAKEMILEGSKLFNIVCSDCSTIESISLSVPDEYSTVNVFLNGDTQINLPFALIKENKSTYANLGYVTGCLENGVTPKIKVPESMINKGWEGPDLILLSHPEKAEQTISWIYEGNSKYWDNKKELGKVLLIPDDYGEYPFRNLAWIKSFKGRELLVVTENSLERRKINVTTELSGVEVRIIKVLAGDGAIAVIAGFEDLKSGSITTASFSTEDHTFTDSIQVVLKGKKWLIAKSFNEEGLVKLTLATNKRKYDVYQHFWKSMSAKILWAGDLNNDDKLDLIFDADDQGCPSNFHLILSTENVESPYEHFSQVEYGDCA